ncbi:MAG TPA: GPR1/FUN34/YaaH family transporter, partial [Labilithrix sp.]
MSTSENIDPAAMTRIMVRPLGSPLPLGFFAFAVGSALQGAFDAGWIPPPEAHAVAIALLTFVGPLELLACIIAYLARDTAGATSLGFFGASWMVSGSWLSMMAPDARSATIAVFAIVAALALVLLAIASAATKPMFSVVLVLATVRVTLLAAHHLGAGQAVNVAGAAVAFVASAMAFYAALALLFEDLKKRTV